MTTLAEMILSNSLPEPDLESARLALETSVDGVCALLMCASIHAKLPDFPRRVAWPTQRRGEFVAVGRASDGVWRITGTSHELRSAARNGMSSSTIDSCRKAYGHDDFASFERMVAWTNGTAAETIATVAPSIPRHALRAILTVGWDKTTRLGIWDYKDDPWIDGLVQAGVDFSREFGSDCRIITPYLRNIVEHCGLGMTLLRKGLLPVDGFDLPTDGSYPSATPVEAAIVARKVDLVEAMLEGGLDPNAVGRPGWMMKTLAKMIAGKWPHEGADIFAILEARGLDLEASFEWANDEDRTGCATTGSELFEVVQEIHGKPRPRPLSLY